MDQFTTKLGREWLFCDKKTLFSLVSLFRVELILVIYHWSKNRVFNTTFNHHNTRHLSVMTNTQHRTLHATFANQITTLQLSYKICPHSSYLLSVLVSNNVKHKNFIYWICNHSISIERVIDDKISFVHLIVVNYYCRWSIMQITFIPSKWLS